MRYHGKQMKKFKARFDFQGFALPLSLLDLAIGDYGGVETLTASVYRWHVGSLSKAELVVEQCWATKMLDARVC